MMIRDSPPEELDRSEIGMHVSICGSLLPIPLISSVHPRVTTIHYYRYFTNPLLAKVKIVCIKVYYEPN